jgi:hypothetical protein
MDQTVEITYRDMMERELKVGDVVAYAAQWGSSSTLRLARIDALKLSKSRYSSENLRPRLLLTALGQACNDHANGFYRMGKRITLSGTYAHSRGYRFDSVIRIQDVDFEKLLAGASNTNW